MEIIIDILRLSVKYWYFGVLIWFCLGVLSDFLCFWDNVGYIRNSYPYNKDNIFMAYFHYKTRGIFRKSDIRSNG